MPLLTGTCLAAGVARARGSSGPRRSNLKLLLRYTALSLGRAVSVVVVKIVVVVVVVIVVMVVVVGKVVEVREAACCSAIFSTSHFNWWTIGCGPCQPYLIPPCGTEWAEALRHLDYQS